MRHILLSSVALSSALVLSGCGGGSANPSASLATAAVTNPAPAPAPTPTPTPTPQPTTPAGFIVAESLEGAAARVADFDVENGLKPAWGSGQIPNLYTQDRSVGAFRFTCGGKGKLSYDDPVVYAGQPNASHLHQIWGSATFDAFTTPDSLAAEASTNCNDTAYSANRSSYWMPALINDDGYAVQPDLVSVYYKRPTSTSEFCDPNGRRFRGTCVGLPNQIRFVFGWDSKDPTAEVKGAKWYCTGGDKKKHPDLDSIFASGCGVGDLLIANTNAPDCWDGKHLDSPNHRSHVAYSSYGSWGYKKCPESHPYVIPQEENKVQFTVTADMINPDGTSRVRLSSDAMLPGARPGETLHADYMESWVGAVKQMWMDHCIEQALNCSGGDLGNGKQLIGASQPSYGWRNPSPLVAVPDRSGS